MELFAQKASHLSGFCLFVSNRESARAVAVAVAVAAAAVVVVAIQLVLILIAEMLVHRVPSALNK